jgi:hypothetical protein
MRVSADYFQGCFVEEGERYVPHHGCCSPLLFDSLK